MWVQISSTVITVICGIFATAVAIDKIKHGRWKTFESRLVAAVVPVINGKIEKAMNNICNTRINTMEINILNKMGELTNGLNTAHRRIDELYKDHPHDRRKLDEQDASQR